MEYNSNVLRITNIDEISSSIQNFIKDQIIHKFKRKGAIIGISGGIDSAVTAALSVNAIGNDKVLGIIMPEKDSNPNSQTYAENLARKLGIKTEIIDLTKILDAYDVYKIRNSIVKKNFSQFDDSCKYRIVVPNNLLEKDRMGIPYLEILDSKNQIYKIKLSLQDYSTLYAATTIKIRARMILLYFHAEKNNYAVVGTTNKSEFVQGYFAKYGDGGVDIDPLADLYKTQVYQLAEYLQIPQEIIKRPASPDTWNFEVNDSDFFFSLPYDVVDLLWYAKENNIPIETIEKALHLTQEQIKRIFYDQERKWSSSAHMREMPPHWKFRNQ